VGTPFAFQTIQVSTVVAAHGISPEAMARWRSFWGIFLIDTSMPFFWKMPVSFANVRGAKPVQPEMPMPTLVSCALAEPARRTVPTIAALNVITFRIDTSIDSNISQLVAAPRRSSTLVRIGSIAWIGSRPFGENARPRLLRQAQLRQSLPDCRND